MISISFHPDEVLHSRVTGQSTSGSARMWLPFPFASPTYVRTHTDTTNCNNYYFAAVEFSCFGIVVGPLLFFFVCLDC